MTFTKTYCSNNAYFIYQFDAQDLIKPERIFPYKPWVAAMARFHKPRLIAPTKCNQIVCKMTKLECGANFGHEYYILLVLNFCVSLTLSCIEHESLPKLSNKFHLEYLRQFSSRDSVVCLFVGSFIRLFIINVSNTL